VEIIGKEFKEFKELQGGRARSQEPGVRRRSGPTTLCTRNKGFLD
jgi:hypothetical protein